MPEENLTPAQIEMRQNAQAFNKTVWQGAATGALFGALVGALAASDGQRAEGALLGAVVGGVAGGAAGNYLASKQRQYASQEEVLDSMIADARERNVQAVQYNASLEVVVAEHQATLASLDRRVEEQLLTDTEYRAELATLERDRRIVLRSVEGIEDEIGNYRQARDLYVEANPKADVSVLDDELDAISATFTRTASLGEGLAVRGA